MHLFLSSEIEDYNQEHASMWREVRNETEKRINHLLEGGGFGDAVEELGIIPNIFTDNALKKFGYEERRQLYSGKRKSTDYRFRIDHKAYTDAQDKGTLRRLLLLNIIESISALDSQLKEKRLDFQGQELIAAIRKEFHDTF